MNTAAIQAAVDCPLAHTVIVPKMPGPWIVEPPVGSGELDQAGNKWRVAALNFSRMASNKTVIFKAGSTVQAARWSFAEEKASLAIVGGLWSKSENLYIVGEPGASWKMFKADYQVGKRDGLAPGTHPGGSANFGVDLPTRTHHVTVGHTRHRHMGGATASRNGGTA